MHVIEQENQLKNH